MYPDCFGQYQYRSLSERLLSGSGTQSGLGSGGRPRSSARGADGSLMFLDDLLLESHESLLVRDRRRRPRECERYRRRRRCDDSSFSFLRSSNCFCIAFMVSSRCSSSDVGGGSSRRSALILDALDDACIAGSGKAPRRSEPGASRRMGSRSHRNWLSVLSRRRRPWWLLDPRRCLPRGHYSGRWLDMRRSSLGSLLVLSHGARLSTGAPYEPGFCATLFVGIGLISNISRRTLVSV